MKNEITAKRLAFALSNLNMKPQELANKSGVSKASISQYINGSHAPSNISSGKMGPVLGVDPLWLMGFDVPMCKDTTQVTSSLYDMSNWMKHTKNEVELLDHFSKLNLRGEEEAIKRVKELIYVPDYTENKEEWLIEIPGTRRTIETDSGPGVNGDSTEIISHSSTFTLSPTDLLENESHTSILNAARKRTDIKTTKEMKQNDNDIMNDPDF